MRRAALILALAATTGCTTWEPIAGQYGLLASETQRICVVHAEAFWEAGELSSVPSGKIHWIEQPAAILEFLGAMEGREVTADGGLRDADTEQGGRRALAILFFPEDAYSRKTIELDEHLDILAGYVQHGTVVTRSPYHTSPKFKRALLDVLGDCRICRDYLGVHPVAPESGESSP